MINYDRVRIIKRFIYVMLAVIFFAPAILAIVLFVQMQGLKTELYESNAHLDQMAAKYFAPLEDQNSQALNDLIVPPAAQPTPPDTSDDAGEPGSGQQEQDNGAGETGEVGSAALSPAANGAGGSIEAELEPSSSLQPDNTTSAQSIYGDPASEIGNPSSGIANPLTGISNENE